MFPLMLKYVFHLFLFLIFQGCGSVLRPLFFMLIAVCLPVADIDSERGRTFLHVFFFFKSSVHLKSSNNKAGLVSPLCTFFSL